MSASNPKIKNVVIEVLEDEENNSRITVHRDGALNFFPPHSVVRYKLVGKLLQSFNDHQLYLKKIVDIGCGDLKFLHEALLTLPAVQNIVCIDKDLEYLIREKRIWQRSDDRRSLDLMITLLQGDILKLPLPNSLADADAITFIEVVEHLEIKDVGPMMFIIFHILKPKTFIMTTPNTDFNIDFPIKGSKFRHYDHKYELNSVEFRRMCYDITDIFDDYCVSFTGCGLGKIGRCLSQIALFVRKDFIDDNFAVQNNCNRAFAEVISEIKTFKLKGVNQIQSSNIVPKNSTNYELIKSVKSTLIEKMRQTNASGKTKRKKNRNTSNDSEKSRMDKKFFTENNRIVQNVKYFSSYVMFTNQIESSLNSLVWELKSVVNASDSGKMRKMTHSWDFEIEDVDDSILLSKHPYKCETAKYQTSVSSSCDCEDREDEDCCGSSNCSYVPYEIVLVRSDDMENVELDTVKGGVIVMGLTVLAIPLKLAMDYINFHDEEKLRNAMKNSDSFVTLEISGVNYFKFTYTDTDSDSESINSVTHDSVTHDSVTHDSVTHDSVI